MNTNLIKLDLYDNAMDSFIVAIDAFIRGKDVPRYYKISIKEMFSAFELILKDILSSEHNSFIYENIEDITKAIELRRTVKFETLISRLKSMVDFTLEDRYLEVIKRLRVLRNMSQHSTLEINEYNAADLISKAVPIMMHIHHEFYDTERNLTDILGEDYAIEYIKIKSAVKALNKDALRRFDEDKCKRIDIKDVKLLCVFCNSDLIVNDGEKMKCYCCHEEFEVVDFLQTFAQSEEELDGDNIFECSKCGMDSLFQYLPYQNFICLNCGHQEGMGMCSDCLDELPLSMLNDETDYYGEKVPSETILVCEDCGKRYLSDEYGDF